MLDMKYKKTLFTFLCAIFLAGQIPYAYFYCQAMKKAIDGRMMTMCRLGHSGASATFSSSKSFPRARYLSKNTVDQFDSGNAAIVSAPLTSPVPISDPPLVHLADPGLAGFGHPPPDLTLLTCNLRI